MCFILWKHFSNESPKLLSMIELLEMTKFMHNDVVHEVSWEEHELIAKV